MITTMTIPTIMIITIITMITIMIMARIYRKQPFVCGLSKPY